MSLPWGPIQAVLAVVLVHLALIFGLIGRHPTAKELAEAGGLVAGLVSAEPWRLLTYLFVHTDPSHVFWNGFSMMVFAVPLILDLGYLRSAAIYLAGGTCGGLAALLTARAGVVTIGSSGAVAGLFGAWLALAFIKARRASLPRRSRIRAMGIALLVLPTLLSPTTSTGQAISVESHLGGLAAGLVAGVLLGRYGPDLPDGEAQEEEAELPG